MFCPECNSENSDNAKFCKNCGAPLNKGFSQGPIASQRSASSSQASSSDNRNVIIIALALVLCAVIIAGAYVLTSNNDGSSESEPVVNDSNVDSVDTAEQEEAPTTAEAPSSMKIHSGTISTGSAASDKTYCSVYVGTEHAGENCKISVLYSRDGSDLNKGNIVPKTVDSSGYVSVPSADAFEYYPDTALVTIYDANGNKLDQLTVYLATRSGSQSF